MNFLEKYLKYKNKYLKLKNQIGGTCTICNMDHQGTSCPQYDKSFTHLLLLADPEMKLSAAADPEMKPSAAAEPKIINMYKIMSAYDINKNIGTVVSKRFLESDYIFNNQIYFINSGMIKIKNGENIDENIIILKSEDFMSDDIDLTTHSFDYLTYVLSKYRDMNLFITFAPGLIKEYYFPLFLDQYLEENLSEKLVVMIIGRSYTNYPAYEIRIADINEYIGKIKTKFGTRIKFIHVYTNFDFNILTDRYTYVFNENFKKFLHDNKSDRELNILYIGFSLCGMIRYSTEDIDYILIGCYGYDYKDRHIEFTIDLKDVEYSDRKNATFNFPQYSSDQKCSYIFPLKNIMIDMPNECKINYDMIKDIIKE